MSSSNNGAAPGRTQDVGRLMGEAVAHHQAGRHQQAEWLYQAVLQMVPGHADANHNLGVVTMQANRPAEALPRLKAALEARPEVSQYWLSYIAALMQAGHAEAARQMLTQGMQRGLSGPEVDRLASRLGVGAVVAPTPEEIGHALALYGERRFAELVPIAQVLTQRFPDHGFGWQLLGAVLKEQGRFQDALAPMQRATSLLPDDAEAQTELGLVFAGLGRLSDAEACHRKAVALSPDAASAHFGFGNTLLALRRLPEAERCFLEALRAGGDFAEGHNNLGVCQQLQGDDSNAEESFRRAIALRADYAEAWRNLGAVLLNTGQAPAAIASLRQAVAVGPLDADSHFLLANAYEDSSRFEEAEAAYRQAIRLSPDHAAAHSNLGALLMAAGRYAEAESHCRHAVAVSPSSPEALNNLGFSLLHQGASAESGVFLDRALALKPDFAQALSNRGALLASLGRFAQAEDSLRQALAIDGHHEGAYGALLFALNYDPDKHEDELVAAYRDYDERFALPMLDRCRPHPNARTAARRLKVGYVSPDFNAHSIQRFLEPLMAHHDHGRFEVFAYAEVRREDAMTARYKSHVDHWLPTVGMTDDALAERIREDRIDILVDLAGHTTGNRLLVFARKPAPVSVSWLGYGYTTGVSAIDYLLTDEASAPAGSEYLFAERPWRLATPGYVYRPAEGMGEVSGLPAAERGYVTFGTLTRGVRINHRVVRVWSEILKRLPQARLVIDSRDFLDESLCVDTRQRFERHGIGRERLQIGYHTPPWDVLRGMDIGLDCFPHNSGTTLFESLYMGVPFVTLAGRPSVGRLGSSILEGLGHPEWIVRSEEEYIEKAVALAGDLPRLTLLRAGLRQEMADSPLMDEAGFTRRVEAAYRDMWADWVRNNP